VSAFDGFTDFDVGDDAVAALVGEVAPTTPALAAPQAPAPDESPSQAGAGDHQTSEASYGPQAGQASNNAITLDNIGAAVEQSRDALIDHWAQNYFTLTQEESDALATQPEAVLPRLIARGLYYALSAVPAQIKQFVPGLVNATISANAQHQSSANEFYASWPGLKGHESATVQALQMIVARKPNVTRSEAIRQAGSVVCALLGLDPAVVGSKGTNGGGRAARVVAQQPFVPAGASGGVRPMPNGGGPPPASGDWFDAMDLPFTE